MPQSLLLLALACGVATTPLPAGLNPDELVDHVRGEVNARTALGPQFKYGQPTMDRDGNKLRVPFTYENADLGRMNGECNFANTSGLLKFYACEFLDDQVGLNAKVFPTEKFVGTECIQRPRTEAEMHEANRRNEEFSALTGRKGPSPLTYTYDCHETNQSFNFDYGSKILERAVSSAVSETAEGNSVGAKVLESESEDSK